MRRRQEKRNRGKNTGRWKIRKRTKINKIRRKFSKRIEEIKAVRKRERGGEKGENGVGEETGGRTGRLGEVAGLDDLKGLFQPVILWFYDSISCQKITITVFRTNPKNVMELNN